VIVEVGPSFRLKLDLNYSDSGFRIQPELRSEIQGLVGTAGILVAEGVNIAAENAGSIAGMRK
jgi:hypothetical protein